MDTMLRRQYEQYRQYRENNETIQRLYHDLKHQIAFIRAEKNEERKEAHLAELNQALNLHEVQVETGNSVLDTLITSKSLSCLDKSISRILEKYGGHISFDNRQNWFAVLMLVPLPQE